MARKKYNWERIKVDYDKGMSQVELRKKYDIGAGALGNKIKRDGWRLSQEQNDTISEFKESVVKISESIHNANETQKELIVDAMVTTLEDNELIVNNRKILKAFQSNIVQGIKNGLYEKPSDIRAGVGAIKDIEAVANPTKPNQVNVQQNNTTEIKQIEVKFIE